MTLRWPKLEPWQRNQYVVVVTVAAAFLGLDFASPFLPLYVIQLGVTDLGEAALWSGTMVAVGPLAAAIMGPIWGGLADRFGYKKMVLRAMLAISCSSMAMAAAPDVHWAFAIRVAVGLLAGFTPLALALVVSTAPRERVGQAVGLMQAAQLAPSALGPNLGGLASQIFGLRANFMVSGVMVLLASLVLLFNFEEDRAASAAAAAAKRPARASTGRWGLFKLPGFAATMGVLFLAQFIDRSLAPILPLYLKEIGTPDTFLATTTGAVVGFGAVSAAVSATLYGRRAKQGQAYRLLLIAVTAGALIMAPMALAQNWVQVFGLRVLLGLCTGGTVALAYTFGTRIAPPDQTGLALGVLVSSTLIGSACAPLMSGLVGRLNLRAVFLVDCLCYLAILAIVLLALRGLDRAPASESLTAST